MRPDTAGPAAGRSHDPLTVLGIGVVAYVVGKLVHELVGHGLACELVGGDLLAVSSSWASCDKGAVDVAGRRVVEAAGTGANLLVGVAALLAVRLARKGGATAFFVWLTAAVNLLVAGGYLMVDPLFGFGDWGDFLEGLEPLVAWRLGTSAVGAAISLGAFFLLRGPLEAQLGGPVDTRSRQARLLCWLPYVGAGGVVMTGAAALNVLGLRYALTSALATVGGTFLLVWLPLAIDRSRGDTGQRQAVGRSVPWLVAGIAAALFLAGWFGPGLKFGHPGGG